MTSMLTFLLLCSQIISFLSRYLVREFCFVICLFHPPSILLQNLAIFTKPLFATGYCTMCFIKRCIFSLTKNLSVIPTDKVFIKTIFSGIDFLGWMHFPNHRVLRTTTKKRMFRNIEQNLKPNTIESYLGLLRHGNTYKIRQNIQNMDRNLSVGFVAERNL